MKYTLNLEVLLSPQCNVSIADVCGLKSQGSLSRISFILIFVKNPFSQKVKKVKACSSLKAPVLVKPQSYFTLCVCL